MSRARDIADSAATINALDGVTATGTELNYLDITTLGTSQSSKAVTADATGALSIDVPYDMTIIDAWAVCTTANASGTLTVRSGTNAITSAIVCAVDTTLSRTTLIDDDYSAITTSTSLNVIANGAADRGIVYIMGVRT